MHEEIIWNWTDADTFTLLKKAYVNNSKLPLVRTYQQKLLPPQGWKRNVDAKLTYLNLTYQIQSLPETKIPYVDSSLSQIEIDRITSEFFWKSSQYRLEIYSSNNNGVSWCLRNTIPLKRPEGFPIQNIDLLSSLGNRARSLPQGTRLALSFRDVGYGVPVYLLDEFTIDYEVEVKEQMYPYVAYQSGSKPVQYITQLSQLNSPTFRSIAPVRSGRKTALCAYASGSASATATIRYGSPTDTTAPTVSVSAGASVNLQLNYEGEISFNGTGSTFNSSLTVTETLN